MRHKREEMMKTNQVQRGKSKISILEDSVTRVSPKPEPQLPVKPKGVKLRNLDRGLIEQKVCGHEYIV